jgi:hypothetical protein
MSWWIKTVKAALVGEDSEAGIIGVVYLDPVHPGQWAVPHVWKRKGYGTPGVIRKLILGPGWIEGWFDEYDLQRLWTWTATRSAASLMLLMGFRYEGKARSYMRTDTGWIDAWQFSLLRKEVRQSWMSANLFRWLCWKVCG